MRRACWAALSILCVCDANAQQAAESYFTKGEKALAESRYGDAEDAYRHLVELDTQSAEVHAKLGMILFQEGKFEQSLAPLRRALRLKPALSDAAVLLAMSISELGHLQDAIVGLEKGFHHSTNPAMKRMAGLELQRAYTGLQQDDKAVEVGLELTRTYPNDPEILYQSGRVFGNYAYLTMMKLSQAPESSLWRHLGAGEAYESQGSYDLALIEYQTVFQLDPRRPGIHYRLGRVFLAKSRPADAAHEFEQEIERDPSNANAAYELGEFHRRSGTLDQARTYFEKAVATDPDFEEAQIGLARTLIALKQPAEAIPHLKKATVLNPGNAVAQFQLARAQGATGDTAGQSRSLAEYERLRAQKAVQENRALQPAREVTKQEIDPDR